MSAVNKSGKAYESMQNFLMEFCILHYVLYFGSKWLSNRGFLTSRHTLM